MNRNFVIAICSIVLMAASLQEIKSQVVSDVFGRIVVSKEGERINYNQEANLSLSSDNILKSTQGAVAIPATVTSDPLWSFSTMGTHIGLNSMHSLDIDNDGTIEIVCSAQYGYQEYMWYILEYNSSNGSYDIIWNSHMYFETINCIEVADLNADNIYEIYIGSKALLEVYNGQSMTMEHSIELNSDIKSVVIGDADNDSEDEVVVLDGSAVVLLNSLSFETETSLGYDASELVLGNVDEDENVEIILNSGKVLEFSNGTVSEEWSFHSESSYGSVDLSDIDKDNMLEIIYAKKWYTISVYDADTKSTKYSYDADLDIHDVLMFDINNDGVDEILYGDGQWGEIHCIDAVSQTELWNIHNPEHGVTKINIADVDGDGTNEVLWAAGWTSTGSDHLFIANIDTKSIEWKSKHIDGPFYAIEIGDIDNDNEDEIVIVSYESNSGYDSGIITIFDAQTKNIEWQSDGNYLDSAWEGVHTVEINDVDNDGIVEIIIAADRTYDGQLWIINGVTKVIEQSKIYYQEDIDEFSALAIEDIDDDGVKEIITGGDDRICIINSADLSVEWKSSDFNTYTRPRKIVVDNIDSDDGLEIISCINDIIIVNAKTKSIKTSSGISYVDFDVADVNNDGKLEIAASTNSGNIHILNEELEIISQLEVTDSKISALNIVDLDKDGVIEYILSVEGQLMFATNEGKFESTKQFSNVAGYYDGLKLYDFDNDGKDEVIFGTNNQVIILPSDVYGCTWFSAELLTVGPDCDAENGQIEIKPKAGLEPYIVNMNNETATLSNSGLNYGTFSIHLQDANGCIFKSDVILEEPGLELEILTTPVSCSSDDDGKAAIQIIKGSEPFDYSWSNGSHETSINSLSEGSYEITVIDSKKCTSTKSFTIDKKKLDFYIDIKNLDCHGTEVGAITTYISSGTEPVSYEWSNGITNSNIENLSGGVYKLVATDAEGCIFEQEFEVTEPDAMKLELTTNPDDTTTPMGEGSAEVIDVKGGLAPYFIKWDDPFQQEGPKASNLIEGTYTVTVMDANSCIFKDEVIVEGQVGIEDIFINGLELFPNPARDFIRIENPVGENVKYNIYNVNGGLIKNGVLLPDSNNYTTVELTGFKSGSYIIQFVLKDSVVSRRIVVQ